MGRTHPLIRNAGDLDASTQAAWHVHMRKHVQAGREGAQDCRSEAPSDVDVEGVGWHDDTMANTEGSVCAVRASLAPTAAAVVASWLAARAFDLETTTACTARGTEAAAAIAPSTGPVAGCSMNTSTHRFRRARDTPPSAGFIAKNRRNPGCGRTTLGSPVDASTPASDTSNDPPGSRSAFSRSITAGEQKLTLRNRSHSPRSSACTRMPSTHSN